MDKKTITASTEYIAACGLYCGACRKYLNGKCPGCKQNEKATWCKIRQCCIEKEIHSCADCTMNVKDCKIRLCQINCVKVSFIPKNSSVGERPRGKGRDHPSRRAQIYIN